MASFSRFSIVSALLSVSPPPPARQLAYEPSLWHVRRFPDSISAVLPLCLQSSCSFNTSASQYVEVTRHALSIVCQMVLVTTSLQVEKWMACCLRLLLRLAGGVHDLTPRMGRCLTVACGNVSLQVTFATPRSGRSLTCALLSLRFFHVNWFPVSPKSTSPSEFIRRSCPELADRVHGLPPFCLSGLETRQLRHGPPYELTTSCIASQDSASSCQ